MTTDNDTAEYPADRQPRNAMREHNPDEWDPDEDAFTSGEVNIWDPINGEGYNEPGHWADRDADMDSANARKLDVQGEFDGHEHLPLISSDMRGVPTEGVQGTYTRVIRYDDGCPECGFGYGTVAVHTMAGVHTEVCLVCETVTSQG